MNRLKLDKKTGLLMMVVVLVAAIVFGGNLLTKSTALEPVTENTIIKTLYQIDWSKYEANMIGIYTKKEAEITGYTVTIGDESYIFETLEEIQDMLELVLDETITTGYAFDVLAQTDGLQVDFTQEQPIEVNIEDKQLVTATLDASQATPDMNAIVLDETPSPAIYGFGFLEAIEIKEYTKKSTGYASAIDVAANLLRQDTAPRTYAIQSGDVPSLIAEAYSMSLSDLYDINPGMRENASRLQIGDEIIVEKLIPKLSVVTETIEVRTEPIDYDIEYVDDDTIYVGLEIATTQGIEGVLEVTESVKTSNNEVIEVIRIDEQKLSEPVTAIVSVGTKPIPDVGSVGFLIHPTWYRITSYYGPRWGGFHSGIDFGTPYGTPIYAADGGTVTKAGWNGGYGILVEVTHINGMVTRYAHNSSTLVSVGQEIGQGQLISYSGNTGNSTGPHMHFEVLINGTNVNPLDYFND